MTSASDDARLVFARKAADPLREIPQSHPQASEVAPLERSFYPSPGLCEQRLGSLGALSEEVNDHRTPLPELIQLC